MEKLLQHTHTLTTHTHTHTHTHQHTHTHTHTQRERERERERERKGGRDKLLLLRTQIQYNVKLCICSWTTQKNVESSKRETKCHQKLTKVPNGMWNAPVIAEFGLQCGYQMAKLKYLNRQASCADTATSPNLKVSIKSWKISSNSNWA